MPYTAKFSKIFLKKHARLPSGIKLRVTENLKEILIKPHIGIMLVGPLRGVWKAKVGKYRILYEINENEKTVIFHNVELRKRVYKR